MEIKLHFSELLGSGDTVLVQACHCKREDFRASSLRRGRIHCIGAISKGCRCQASYIFVHQPRGLPWRNVIPTCTTSSHTLRLPPLRRCRRRSRRGLPSRTLRTTAATAANVLRRGRRGCVICTPAGHFRFVCHRARVGHSRHRAWEDELQGFIIWTISPWLCSHDA